MSPDETIFAFFEKLDRRFAAWFEVSWSALFEGCLPVEMCIAQLPTRFTRADRHYSVSYRPIYADAARGALDPGAREPVQPISAVLIVVTDVTELVIAERTEEEQRELLAVLQRAMSDRGILREFIEESRLRVSSLCRSTFDPTVEKRELHTLKGNAGLFGLIRTSRLCHELEEKLAEDRRGLSAEERALLSEHWQQVEARVLPLLGEAAAMVQLSMPEYRDVLDAVAHGQPYSALYQQIRGWAHEPMHQRLEIYAEQIKALAKRLGKGDVTVQIDDGGVRLPREVLQEFWASFSHVVRNSVDHGLESADERLRCGKPIEPRVELVTRIEHCDAVIEIGDDGRGIDWGEVALAASAKGLPTQTKQQLEAALFADGLSTRSNVTDVSGRGVGLAAVQGAVRALGGTISIETSKGHGTRFSFRFNLPRLRPSIACPPLESGVRNNERAGSIDAKLAAAGP